MYFFNKKLDYIQLYWLQLGLRLLLSLKTLCIYCGEYKQQQERLITFP